MEVVGVLGLYLAICLLMVILKYAQQAVESSLPAPSAESHLLPESLDAAVRIEQDLAAIKHGMRLQAEALNQMNRC